jgi:hypothetical protein
MKSFITPTYTFTPGAAGIGTLNLSGISNFDIKRLLAVINARTNTLIYNVLDSTLGYTSVLTTIITLDADTSAMLSTDPLQIVYDTDDAITNGELITFVKRTDALLEMLQRLIKVNESLQVVDSAQRQRIAIDTIAAGVTLPTVTTVTGVTTVSTVNTVSAVTAVSSITNVAANAGMDREQYINIAKQTYASSIRPNLKFQ